MRYSKHGKRRITAAHNAAHEALAATDRAKEQFRRTLSPSDLAASRAARLREEKAVRTLIEAEKRERIE